MNLTKELAAWAGNEMDATHAPSHVEKAQHAIIDGIAVALAGASVPVSLLLRDFLGIEESPSSDARALIGGGRAPDGGAAAKLNAVAMHSLDFDDISHPAYAHVTTVMLPALLTVGCPAATGEDIVSAYLIGLEVSNRL